MTELMIDGQSVVLPEKFTVKKTSENPYFTKGGDYTLNITLSLENPINQAVYKNIQRLQSNSRFVNRTAILISDNKVVIKGKEVILKHTNNQVEIQIVAGNSSLNYMVGNNLKVRSLSLGSAYVNPNTIVDNLKYTYPQREWHLLPVYDPNADFLYNRYAFYKDANGKYNLKYGYDGNPLSIYDYSGKYNITEMKKWILMYKNYRPQPYLCFIIDLIFTKLGYTITENPIKEHPIYKFAYIVHAENTLEFAKMLPDWTVEKLLSEIEKLLQVTIVVDNHTMTAKFVNNYQFYENSTVQEAIALDDYEAEIEENPDDNNIYEVNVGYNLPEDVYYQYQNVNDEYQYKMGFSTVNGNYDYERIQNIAAQFLNKNVNTYNYFSNDRVYSLKFLFIDYYDKKRNKICPQVINDYKPLIRNHNKEELDVTFDIIPAPFAIIPYYVREQLGLNSDHFFLAQIPECPASEEPVAQVYQNETERQLFLQDYIEGDATKDLITEDKTTSQTQLRIAFYKADFFIELDSNKSAPPAFDFFPCPFVRGISERPNYNSKQYKLIYNEYGAYLNPLSLEYLKENFHNALKKVNKKKTFKIKILNDKAFDPKKLFLIDNKLFYCKKLEYTYTNDGLNPICEGEFYQEEIS